MKKQKKSKKIKKTFLLSCICLFMVIGLTTTIGSMWVEIYNKYQEKGKLEEELIALKEEEEKLTVDSEKLQDPEYVARYAREKYLFTKDGEFVLKMPEN